jgi:ketosteroid isomerase-like protein
MNMKSRSQTKVVTSAADRDAKLDIARRFHAALAARDWSAIRALLTDDAQWIWPGDNTISGTASGADTVIERARKLASYGLKFELLHTLVSRDNMALSLHNTAQQGDCVLDEYVAIVCRLKNGKITEIETFLSDVDNMNAFFI